MRSQGILFLEVAKFHSSGTVTFVQKNKNKKILYIELDELYENQVVRRWRLAPNVCPPACRKS